ncbi:MAG: nucleotide sugar dehydrogenase [Candidatus Micrarchaeota archaeon]|nr:nucleotide sugar dehydrogenase [Candidatus Micrarchaeota archaeon]
MTKVCVIGMGYVGIPVAVEIANAGFDCVGIELDGKKVSALNSGKYPIAGDEPGIAEAVDKAHSSGKFRASSDYSECKDADFIVVCVQTPLADDSRKPNYTYLRGALESAGKKMKKGVVVIVESTLAPGTMQKVAIPSLEKASKLKAGVDFGLVHCPERVRPGALLHNLRNMHRVIGGIDEKSAKKAMEFYSKFIRGNLYESDMLTAEIVKTAENTYRDVEIAFANELAVFCEEIGADFYKVRELVNTSPGRNIHMPGAGVGGHCIPKDSWLLASGVDNDRLLSIVRLARKVNDSMPSHMLELVSEALSEQGVLLGGSKVCLLGVSYIGDSDDTRNTPALPLAQLLGDAGAEVVAYDPFVEKIDGIRLATFEEAIKNSDCLVVVTDHLEFKSLRLGEIASKMRTKCLVDGRKVVEPDSALMAGFVFRGIGRARKK